MLNKCLTILASTDSYLNKRIKFNEKHGDSVHRAFFIYLSMLINHKDLNIVACSMSMILLQAINIYQHKLTALFFEDDVDSSRFTTLTFQIGLIGIIITLFFIYNFIQNIRTVDRKTTKVMAIIGIVPSALIIYSGVNMISKSYPFWEFEAWWISYLILMFIFNLVLLRQSVIIER